jgi:hypothetical protein
MEPELRSVEAPASQNDAAPFSLRPAVLFFYLIFQLFDTTLRFFTQI